jgi:hypothetical protein
MFALFMGWFVGGYIHAKQRLRKGLPLLGYHRVCLLLPLSTHTRTDCVNSSSYPTRNANATARSRRITSLSTPKSNRTTPTKHPTHRAPALTLSPRRYTITVMPRRSTMRHRAPRRRTRARALRCRYMRRRRGSSRVVWWVPGMWSRDRQVNSYRRGRSRRRRC